MFMRDYIISNTHDSCVFISFYPSEYRAQCGAHERQPIPDNNKIRLFLTETVACFYPVEWVYRIYQGNNFDIGRSRLITILSSARKKKTRVL